MAGGPQDGTTPDPERPDPGRSGADPDGDATTGDLGPREVDEAWADIVSDLGSMPSDVIDDSPQPPAAAPDGQPSLVDPIHADPRGWVADDDDDFEPPDPGPVLGGDPLLTMAWVGAVAPPLLLMVIAVIWQNVPPLVLQIAGVVFLAGLGVLIWRMPARRDDDDGPGAVV